MTFLSATGGEGARRQDHAAKSQDGGAVLSEEEKAERQRRFQEWKARKQSNQAPGSAESPSSGASPNEPSPSPPTREFTSAHSPDSAEFDTGRLTTYRDDELADFLTAMEKRESLLRRLSASYNAKVGQVLHEKGSSSEQKLSSGNYFSLHRDQALEMADAVARNAARIRIEIDIRRTR